MAKAKVLAFINYKGGVAKTTSAYHIGCWLAGIPHKKVLLIDIDPQTNLTFLCVSYERWETRKVEVGTIHEMYKRYLAKKSIDAQNYIWNSPIAVIRRIRGWDNIDYLPRVDLVPCDINLIGEDIGRGQIDGEYSHIADVKKNAEQFIRDRSFLSRVINEVHDEYDYILIDCPPNLYLMTENALVASDYYIVTAIPDHLSTIGLTILIDKVKKIHERVKHAASLAAKQVGHHSVAEFGAVLFVRVRIGGLMLTTAHWNIMQSVRERLGTDKCFETYTTELIGYTEAAEHSLPIWLHKSDNARRATEKEEYPKIVKELMEKF